MRLFPGLIVSLVLGTACSQAPERVRMAKSQGANTGDEDADEGAIKLSCKVPNPGNVPLRRLTRFEYNNTVRDLLGNSTSPASALPAEELGNGFGNDATAISVSSLLASQYSIVASRIAKKAVDEGKDLAPFASCLSGSVASSSETSCVKSFLNSFLPKAYRRPVTNSDITAYQTLFTALRKDSSDFKTALGDLIATILQSPEFLYRVEFGDSSRKVAGGSLELTAYEMATRLSYLFWGTMPDSSLLKAAESGELKTREGVAKHAARMIEDPKFRVVNNYFLDALLPINALTELERDKALYPSFNAQIGSLMYQETHKFLDHVLFDTDGEGKWSSAFSADYTFLNEKLADFYGISGVSGDDFQKVKVDGKTRLGLMTQGGFLAGTTHSSTTNPVFRGAFVMKKILCHKIPIPTGEIAALATPPKPTEGTTARERFSQHSSDKVCAGCHAMMDPLGLTFENYDAVGLYRTQESGKTIDASGALPSFIHNGGDVLNAVELSKRIAGSDETNQCFAKQWMTYAYGKPIDSDESCSESQLMNSFKDSGYNVKKMLLKLTETDAFYYRSAKD